jgi:hypothetical protein
MGRIRRYVRVTPWAGIGVAPPNGQFCRQSAIVHAARPLVFFLVSPSGSLAFDALTTVPRLRVPVSAARGHCPALRCGTGVDLSCR